VNGLKEAAFQSMLARAVLAAEAPDVVVFTHGYNVTFEEAAMRAAQFAYDSRFPGLVVLYSWPSRGTVPGYSADEDRALASGDPMARFLHSLEGGPWKKVHVLAHSMGNRVMLSALADNPRPKLPLSQVIFAAADVYVPVFGEKFPKLQSAGALTATSYASRRDRALWFSSMLHAGPRVGLFDDAALPTEGLEAIDSTAVDPGLLAHGYWAGARPLISDLRALLLQGLGAKARGLQPIGKHWAFPK
jgi:esterase/lipase superfamily enzyme